MDAIGSNDILPWQVQMLRLIKKWMNFIRPFIHSPLVPDDMLDLMLLQLTVPMQPLSKADM